MGKKTSKKSKITSSTSKHNLKKTALLASVACASSAFTSSSLTSKATISPYFKTSEESLKNTQAHTSSEEHEKIKSSDNPMRTHSFQAIWSNDITIPIHTLVLGTHPSIESLSRSQNFGHPMNAFWWIAGDCLGFRRDRGISSSSGKPYKLSQHLRYSQKDIISYDKQVELFTMKGFALWDIIQSCERKGSLDSAIKNEVPNSIREFCDIHKSIKRIIMANGTGGCNFFLKHFKSWWEEEGELYPGPNEESLRVFKKYKDRVNTGGRIEVICALAVSPAAAKYDYLQKREFWERYCYEPGLTDYNLMKEEILT